jgi:hypothetical protein
METPSEVSSLEDLEVESRGPLESMTKAKPTKGKAKTTRDSEALASGLTPHVRKVKKVHKTNEALGLDDFTLGTIQVYCFESGLTSREYAAYMNKHYKGVNLRLGKNKLGPNGPDPGVTREVKRQLKEDIAGNLTLFRSLNKFKSKTLKKRKPSTAKI